MYIEACSLMPTPNFHVTVLKVGLVNNHDFLGSAESPCLENATPSQITGLLHGSMMSEVVATRSAGGGGGGGCEKAVNLVSYTPAYHLYH